MPTIDLIPGMVVDGKFGQARVVKVTETDVTLGLGKGRRLRVKRSELEMDRVIEIPPQERPPVQKHVYRAVREVLTDPFVLPPAMLSWLVAACTVPQGGDVPFALIGSDPFQRVQLSDLLSRLNVNVGDSSADTEVLVVGRGNWSETQLKELLDLRVGKSLRVYSQEMLFAWMISGCDPFQSNDAELIRELAGVHLTLTHLEYVLGFEWPSTFVSPSKPGADGSFDALENGYLKHEGYRVGKHGMPRDRRHGILSHCYLYGVVPNSFPDWYIEQWGRPGSSHRLQKIAESLAAFCRNHMRRPNPSRDAIEHWEDDLAWLRETYYQGKYQFVWPGTTVW